MMWPVYSIEEKIIDKFYLLKIIFYHNIQTQYNQSTFKLKLQYSPIIEYDI